MLQVYRIFWHHFLCKCSLTQILMGIIVFMQSDFLKFNIEDSGESGGACLIAAAI